MQIGTQKLFTALDVAAEFGVSRRRVLQLAQERGIGTLVGRQYLFTPNDVKGLKPRPKAGRPKKSEATA